MTPPAATAAGRLAGGVALPAPARTRQPQRSARRADAPQRSRQTRRISGPAAGLQALRQPTRVVKPNVPGRSKESSVAPKIVVEEANVGTQDSLYATAAESASAFRLLSKGRLMILVFAVMLGGLVFAQEQLTGLNASLGSTVQQISELQRDNAVLRSNISALSSDQRVVAQAKRMGYVEPPVGSSKFIAVSSGSSQRAAEMMIAAVNPSAGEGIALSPGINQVSNDGFAAGQAALGNADSQVTSEVAATVGTASAPSDSTAVTTAAVPDSGTDQGNG